MGMRWLAHKIGMLTVVSAVLISLTVFAGLTVALIVYLLSLLVR